MRALLILVVVATLLPTTVSAQLDTRGVAARSTLAA